MEAQAVRYEAGPQETSAVVAASMTHETIGTVPPLPRQQLWHERLPEAYVHLALYYVALGDSASAVRTFKFLLRMFPKRRLAPSAHSPAVIGLFEQARAELIAECANGAPQALGA